LKHENLVELALELTNEGCFIIVGPGFSFAIVAILKRLLERFLQAIVIDIVPVVILDQGLLELLAESAGI